MSAAISTKPRRVTEAMLAALRRLESGQSLRGHVHMSTYWTLRRRGLIEDSDTITDAGRAALAKVAAS